MTVGLAAYPLDGGDREELHRCADAELIATKHGSKMLPGFTGATSAGGRPRWPPWTRRLTPPEDHSSRGGPRYAGAIARISGCAARELGLIRLAGMLHDVGKIAIPTASCSSPRLSPAGAAGPQRHPDLAPSCRVSVPGARSGGDVDLATHTRMGRTGDPDGRSGEAIPLGSRILNVAQAFAAMTGRRTYRFTVSSDEALEELQRSPGGNSIRPASRRSRST